MARREIIIKETHRGLYYEDGVVTQVLVRDDTPCLVTSTSASIARLASRSFSSMSASAS